jgi:hypothetical protein
MNRRVAPMLRFKKLGAARAKALAEQMRPTRPVPELSAEQEKYLTAITTSKRFSLDDALEMYGLESSLQQTNKP